jgi:hypothetical protein
LAWLPGEPGDRRADRIGPQDNSTESLEFPSGHLLQIAAYGVATAVAFTLTFAALSRIGCSKTAVVMTLEAVSTVVLAALVLGEPVSVAQRAWGWPSWAPPPSLRGRAPPNRRRTAGRR